MGAPHDASKGLAERLSSWSALAIAVGLLLASLLGAFELGVFRSGPEEFRARQRDRAWAIRRAARRACASGDAPDCIGLYDQAKRMDPEGDTDPEVQRDRAAATTTEAGATPEASTPASNEPPSQRDRPEP